MSYIFLLGRKSELCLAELRERLGVVELIGQHMALYKGELPSESQGFLDSLGGTIKICSVISHICDWQSFIPKFLIKHFKGANSKVNFGISSYSLTNSHEISLKKLLINVKKSLQEAGLKPRFVNKMFKNVAHTAIYDSGLLRHGIEICVFHNNDKAYITKTVAVQDFKTYGLRDYERPMRDGRSGMLPPKLAQIMINLSGIDKGLLWDPFCGSGTVLMEGLLMGFDMVGSDISDKAIHNSRMNLDWLERHFRFEGEWRVFVEDALKADTPIGINAIVTETYLGPPLKTTPEENQIRANLAEVAEIVFGFLRNIKVKIPIVMAIPFIRGGKRNFHIENFVENIEKLGYSVSVLDDNKKTLLYDRPDQFIGREIIRLQKT